MVSIYVSGETWRLDSDMKEYFNPGKKNPSEIQKKFFPQLFEEICAKPVGVVLLLTKSIFLALPHMLGLFKYCLFFL